MGDKKSVVNIRNKSKLCRVGNQIITKGRCDKRMKETAQSKLLFVINSLSGGNNKIVIQKDICQYFETLRIHIKLINLTGKQDDILVRQYILLFQPDKVIVVGGDGTIKLIAELLI